MIQAVNEQARDWYLRQNLNLTLLPDSNLTLAITIDEMRAIVSHGPKAGEHRR